MKYGLIDTENETLTVYSCKSDIAGSLGLNVKTISRWQKQTGIKHHKGFIICFNVSVKKATQKANNQVNNIL